MKNLLFLISVLTILIFSCKKEEIKPNKINLDEFIGGTYFVVEWNFKDFDTGENYDLLEVNSSCDSIYVHFGSTKVVVLQVDWHKLPTL